MASYVSDSGEYFSHLDEHMKCKMDEALKVIDSFALLYSPKKFKYESWLRVKNLKVEQCKYQGHNKHTWSNNQTQRKIQ